MEIEKLIAAVKLCGSSPRVEQCRECAYWAGGDMSKCIPRMTADAATALEHLQAENDRLKEEVQQMRWIPVEERLPKPEENPVLAFDCTGPVMAWYSPTMGWMYRTGIAGCGITHWMHLPQPPKEETHEK